MEPDLDPQFEGDTNSTPLTSFEDLYSSISTMEDFSASDNIENNTPAGAVSFSSWNLSPIPTSPYSQGGEEENKLTIVTGQTPEPLTTAPGDTKGSNDYRSTSQEKSDSGHTIQGQYEYGTIYQNPHNYGASTPGPSDYGSCVYQPRMVPMANYGGYVTNYACRYTKQWNEMHHLWHIPANFTLAPRPHSVYVRGIPQGNYVCSEMNFPGQDYHDPHVNLCGQEMEFARCSTPEFMMALKTLQSPVKGVNLDQPYFDKTNSISNGSKMIPNNLTDSLKHQDSGYNSDLNISPVIEYQNTKQTLIVGRKRAPSGCYPILRMANMADKENLMPNQSRAPPGYFPMSAAGITPKSRASCSKLGQANFYAPSATVQSSSISVQDGQIQSCSVTSTGQAKSEATHYLVEKHLQNPKPEPVPTETLTRTSKQEQKPLSGKRKLLDDTNDTYVPRRSCKRPRHNEPLDLNAVTIMQDWFESHLDNPYPSKSEKERLAELGNISVTQVKSWFANKRNRSNNTRPKKQKQKMAGKLLDICHQLARDAKQPQMDNAYYIQQLSSILSTPD